MAWYVVWPDGHDMVYGLALRALHGIWYGLVGMTWYVVCFDGHGMAWHGI